METATHLTHLTLRDFRCFHSYLLEPQPGLNFFVGPNAQGKTSLLEAACLLLRLKSPRMSNLQEAIHFGATAFALEGNYAGKQMGLRFAPTQQPKSLLSLDGVMQQDSAEYLTTGRVVWFGSEDREIITGSGERRRRFLDSAGLQLGHDYRHHQRFYDRALRSRNMLLRTERPRREVEAYDLPLAKSGDALITLRANLVAMLNPLVATFCDAISGEKMTLHYQPGATLPMLQALIHARAKEAQLRFTPVGPHRDEVLILLNDLPAATFASEGQRRTIALALKLALAQLLHQQTGAPPLLLLDDIFGELDPARRNALLAGLPPGAQALLTTTDLKTIHLPSMASVVELSQKI